MGETSALNNHAGNLYRLGEVAAAAALQEQVLASVEAGALGVQPVALRTNLGVSVLRLGQAERALALADTDAALAEQAGSRASMAISHLIASRALVALGRVDEAEQRLAQAETVWKGDPRAYARMLSEAALQRAELRAARGDLTAAQALNRASLVGAAYPDRLDAPGLDRLLRQGARLALLSGNAAEADALARAAVEQGRRIARDERHSADVGEAALLRAQALQMLERIDEAQSHAGIAVDALTHGLGADHVLAAEARGVLASLRDNGTRR